MAKNLVLPKEIVLIVAIVVGVIFLLTDSLAFSEGTQVFIGLIGLVLIVIGFIGLWKVATNN
jgi:membrane-bound ClpP family serine protease